MTKIALFIKHKTQPGKRDEVCAVWKRHMRFAIVDNPCPIQELTKHKLINEYQFLVHPIVLEKGIPLFKDRVNMKLVKSEPFKSGVVLLANQLGKK